MYELGEELNIVLCVYTLPKCMTSIPLLLLSCKEKDPISGVHLTMTLYVFHANKQRGTNVDNILLDFSYDIMFCSRSNIVVFKDFKVDIW